MSYLSNFHYQMTGPGASAALTAASDDGHKNARTDAKDDSPKLVFLHGVMGYTANWRRIAKAFEHEYQVLVYDQRGHGRSFQPAVGYGPEDYAGDLEKILDEIGWSKIHLVGHSMGGRVAYHFAKENPHRVERLVIEDVGPSILPAGASFIIKLLDSIPVPFAGKREAKSWFDTTFMELYRDHRQKEGLAAYLYANLMENERGEAVWRFYETGIRESVAQGRATERWEEIQELSMPTLVVRGQYSSDLPRDVFERMMAINPRIEGVEIPNAGHWVHSDQPQLFIDALNRFFHPSREIS